MVLDFLAQWVGFLVKNAQRAVGGEDSQRTPRTQRTRRRECSGFVFSVLSVIPLWVVVLASGAVDRIL